MISKTDVLINNYERVLKEPWNVKLSGQEKVWFLVYDPAEQRRVLFRLGDFENTTRKHNHGWVEVDLSNCFPTWMAAHEYREEYFNNPLYIKDSVEKKFKSYVVSIIKNAIISSSENNNTVIAITYVSSLFGFLKLSEVLNEVYALIKGRILIFFPGEYQNNQYRLMDARDGWSYLARPITA